MKRLFYLSGSIFFLSLSLLIGLQIGERVATAAPGDKIVGFAPDPTDQSRFYTLLANGDLYVSCCGQAGVFVRNVWQQY